MLLSISLSHLIINGRFKVIIFLILSFFIRLHSRSLPFTGVVELNWEILLDLDYQALARACQVNKKINKICQDDRFWKEKVRRDFGVDQYKPEEITYQQQYRELIEAKDYISAIQKGRSDVLIALEKKGIESSTTRYHIKRTIQ